MPQFTSTEQVNSYNGVKMLIYGQAGVGKTVLSATAPRPILLSAESGLLSLRLKNLERLFGPGNQWVTYNIPVIEITDVDKLVDAYNWFASSSEAKNFDTICIDSISEIAEVVLLNAKKQVKDPRQAYGELVEKMEHAIRLFRDLPQKHVYMSSKQEPVKDEFTGVVKYGPAMPGTKLGPKLPYFFDEVFRIGVNKDPQGNPYRFIQTQPEFQYDAKDRSGALDAVEAPFLTTIIQKILGD